MWKNYIKVGLRNLLKNKIYVLINVAGLGISMAFCLTIYLLFAFNWEFDNYYTSTDNIFRIHEMKQNTGRGLSRYDLAPMPMGPRAAREISGIESQTRYWSWNENLAYEDNVFNQKVGYVDDNFFDFFKISLKTGSYGSLKDKSKIYLTSRMAKKYFGNSDPVGKILTIHFSAERSVNLTVAGVFENIPYNTSFYFDALTNIHNYLDGRQIRYDDWSIWQQPTTFVKLVNPSNADQVTGQLNRYIAVQNQAREEWKVNKFELVRFKDSRSLDPYVIEGSNCYSRVGSDALYIFAFLAILILTIACFNLANTTMALMGNRVREIGVRKVMGGTTSQVFVQFMYEMFFTSFLALLFGLAIFQWISTWFFSLWSIPVKILDYSILNLVIAFMVLLLLTSFIAGLYPAIYSRRFQPAAIFRNQLKLRRAGLTSRLLNTLQFAFSMIVLAGGMIFIRNADFINSLDLGYQHENVINLYTGDKTEYNLMRDKIKINHDVEDFAGTNDLLGGEYEDAYLALDTGIVEIRSRRVGASYLSLMNVHLTQGRLFNKDLESDYNESVIVNQAYVNRFDLKDPIGKLVNLKSGKRYIIGVTADIINNVYRGSFIIPEIYIPAREDEYHVLVVRATTVNRNKVFDYLASSWKQVIPYKPFNAFYQDDMGLNGAINAGNNLKMIFFYLAIVGSLLSLTGIFALSSLNVASRIKEVGIRRVMGASVKSIMLNMNRQFVFVIATATVLGTILAYFLIQMILTMIYEYHTPIPVYLLVIPGIIISFIALLTTSVTILKAANTNPTQILRNE